MQKKDLPGWPDSPVIRGQVHGFVFGALWGHAFTYIVLKATVSRTEQIGLTLSAVAIPLVLLLAVESQRRRQLKRQRQFTRELREIGDEVETGKNSA